MEVLQRNNRAEDKFHFPPERKNLKPQRILVEEEEDNKENQEV